MEVLRQKYPTFSGLLVSAGILVCFSIAAIVVDKGISMAAWLVILAGAVVAVAVFVLGQTKVAPGAFKVKFKRRDPCSAVQLDEGSYWFFPFSFAVADADVRIEHYNVPIGEVDNSGVTSVIAACKLVDWPLIKRTDNIDAVLTALLKQALRDGAPDAAVYIKERLPDLIPEILEIMEVIVEIPEKAPVEETAIITDQPLQLTEGYKRQVIKDIPTIEEPEREYSKAIIYKEDLEYISKCVLDYPDIETGGDLFGFWTYSGFPVIQYVIGPGRGANHQVAFFNQELDYLVQMGDTLRDRFGLQHIGEWHSHHRLGLARPSGHDVSTVVKAIDHYDLGKFFLVITNIHGAATGIQGFMFDKTRRRDYTDIRWVVLEEENPIKKSFEFSFKGYRYKPVCREASFTDLVVTTLRSSKYIKPLYTPGYWLNEKSGQMTLKAILDSLSILFGEVLVFQDDLDQLVYLKVNVAGNYFHVSFPRQFPKVSPDIALIQGNGGESDYAHAINWDPGENLAEDTVRFITHYFSKF